MIILLKLEIKKALVHITRSLGLAQMKIQLKAQELVILSLDRELSGILAILMRIRWQAQVQVIQ